MNSTASSATDLEVADDNSATVVRASPAMVMRCLLVSVDQRSSEVVEATASNEGWLAEKCAAIDQALRLVFRQKFHLAFIDIHSTSNSPLRLEFEQLASDLARNHIPLLVVSGDPTDPLAEIHARQLGVWLYLPGFDGKTDLDVVFRDARAVHEKLRGKVPLKTSGYQGASEQLAARSEVQRHE
jgi:hypothetical protein